ncbi:MAG: PAS domain S-box protein [Acidobacteriota bacterium]
MSDRPLKILLVEDNEDDYIITRDLLSEIGDGRFRLEWVESYDTAIETMKRCEHDVYLVDYYLVARDGLDLLRQMMRDCLRSPVIMLTGQDRPGLDVEALKAGASDYLVKGSIDALMLDRSIRYACERKNAERALRESEERYRRLFDNNPQPMWVFDFETLRFLAVNEAAICHYGYSREEFLQMTIKDIRPAEDVPLLMENLSRISSGLDPADRWRHLKTDGSIIDVEITSHHLIFGDREARLVLANDITERLRAEDALRQAESKYRLLVEHIPAIAYTAMMDEFGTNVYVSPQIEKTLGFSQSEWMAEKTLWRRQIHPDDRQSAISLFNKTLFDQEPFVCEYRLIDREGKAKWFHDEAVVVRDEAGQAVMLQGVALDITKRKQTEEALARAERRYRSIIQNAAYGIFLSSIDGRFLEVNPALVCMLGYDSAEELMRVDIARDIYTRPEERERLIESYSRSNRIDGIEVEWKRKDGKLVALWLSGQVVRGEQGAVEGFEMIAENLTERRALEEQLRQSQKMDAIGKLAGGVAHDFNNLLTVINGYADLLAGLHIKSDPRRQHAQEIKKAGARASSLTTQLLAFSRKQMLQPVALDLNAVITDSLKMLRRLIGEDIEVIVSLDADAGQIKADPTQIEQVIVNLAVNARDAMPDGGKLTIETSNVEIDESSAHWNIDAPSGPYVMMAISDTGAGMDEETMRCIFEPFFTTKERGRGTGLGLSTVYGIVKQSGGHISVYSEKGLGTTFKIYLPRVDDRAERKSEDEQEEMPRGTETILVVEDERMVRELICRMLRGCGYTVLEAATGEQALEFCHNHDRQIHLLITDVVMPQISGPALAERVKAFRPQMKRLFISGYTDNALINDAVLEGGVEFLQKPFSPLDLARKARQLMDH